MACNCFFICCVKSGFLAALCLGKTKPFYRRYCFVRSTTFFSSFVCNLQSFQLWIFCTSLFIKVSVAFDVFFCPPLNLCLGLCWEAVPWLRLEASLLLTWLFQYKCIFLLWNFFLSPGKNSSLYPHS